MPWYLVNSMTDAFIHSPPFILTTFDDRLNPDERLRELVHPLVAKRVCVRDGYFMAVFLDKTIERLVLQSIVPGRERKV